MHGWENQSSHNLKSESTRSHHRLLQTLQEAISVSLPGQSAQYQAVPPNRPHANLEEVRNAASTRHAAVMALIHPIEDAPHVALIERNTYPGVHSGQISFPGGKMESSDQGLMHAALRETSEEVGVRSDQYRVWGELTEVYIPPSQFLVKPFLGIAQQPLSFEADPREVNQILHVPLDFFLDPISLQPREVNVGAFKVKVPSYTYEGHIIWGATAMMIRELTTLIHSLSGD